MRLLMTLFMVAVFVLPVAAQQALNEQFNFSTTATFPPTGWAEWNINGGPNLGWEDPSVQPVSLNALGNDAAGHDDFVSGVTNDFMLISPPISLVNFNTPRLVFDESLGFSNFLANHPASLGDGFSTIEVSTDGGVTWAVVWNETRTIDFPYYGITVGLAPYAGFAPVELGFHYYGTWAHTWVLDNVIVDNGIPMPTLAVNGNCPGPGKIVCTNMTPGGQVYVGWSFLPGLYTIPAGPCAGVTVPLFNPTLQFTRFADAFGTVSINGNMPPAACGLVTMVAFDVVTCVPTNLFPI